MQQPTCLSYPQFKITPQANIIKTYTERLEQSYLNRPGTQYHLIYYHINFDLCSILISHTPIVIPLSNSQYRKRLIILSVHKNKLPAAVSEENTFSSSADHFLHPLLPSPKVQDPRVNR